MAPIQDRRNLATVCCILILLLACSCGTKSIQKDENYKKLEALLSSEVMQQYDNYLVIFPFRCSGCVEDKLASFIREGDTVLWSHTVVVYDTTWDLHPAFKAYLPHIIHAPSKDIDKVFPRLANICVFKKDATGKTIKEKVVNADDSSLVYYLKKM